MANLSEKEKAEAAKAKADEDAVDGSKDTTQGFGVRPGVTQGVDAGDENEKEDRGPIDPVTNQPLSDFSPAMVGKNGDAEAIAVHNSAIRVGNAMGRVGSAAELVERREADREQDKLDKEARSLTDKANPLPEREYAMIPPDVYRAREQARVMAEARTLHSNRTVPGGRFKVGDSFVNANGEKVK